MDYLELEEVHFLPIRAVQSQNVPSFANLREQSIVITLLRGYIVETIFKKQAQSLDKIYECYLTWADLQRDTTSRKEKTLRRSSRGSILLMGAVSSGMSENIWGRSQLTHCLVYRYSIRRIISVPHKCDICEQFLRKFPADIIVAGADWVGVAVGGAGGGVRLSPRVPPVAALDSSPPVSHAI